MAKLSDDLLRHLPRDRFGPRNRRQSKNPEFCEYQLTFQGFGSAEMKDIVDSLKKFSGYSRHEVLERNKCRQVVAYLSRIARSKLESNYRRMFRELRMHNVQLRFDTLRVDANKLGCPSQKDVILSRQTKFPAARRGRTRRSSARIRASSGARISARPVRYHHL